MTTKKNYGLPVADAKGDLILKITQKDIDAGKPGDNDYCVGVNALCRQEKVKTARVFKNVTYVYNKDGSVTRYMTPFSLYMEIMIFDRGGKFLPGEHRLKAPKGALRLGHHVKPSGERRRRTGRLPRPVHIVSAVREDAPKGIASLRALFGDVA